MKKRPIDYIKFTEVVGVQTSLFDSTDKPIYRTTKLYLNEPKFKKRRKKNED